MDRIHKKMANILYGLCSVGLGHAIRSKSIIENLERKGHKVFIIASHGAFDYLSKSFEHVYNIEGFELVFKNNKVVSFRTFLRNIGKFNPENYSHLREVFEKIKSFKPDLVLSDWESYSTVVARALNIPLIRVDNQMYLVYGEYHVPLRYWSQYWKSRIVLRLLVRKADKYVVMLSPGMKLKKGNDLYPSGPLIREEVRKLRPKKEDFVLVYDSTRSHKKLLSILQKVNSKFVVYGSERVAKDGNITFKGFDDVGFTKDLAKCKAVITTAGFTLINDAIYLGKPMLILPIKKHFEQILNAVYVKENKYGEMYTDLRSFQIKKFLRRLGRYKWSRPEYGTDIYQVLDRAIEDALK
jgi:uncharacterized protein (TIGR00661 family)